MYSGPAKFLHWAAAALIAAAFALVWIREDLPKGTLRAALLDWHQWAGLLVLLGLAVRLVVRFANKPGAGSAAPAWQRFAAWIAEAALYLMMLLQPLLGWLLASLKGHEVFLLGITLPSLAAPDRELAKQVSELHDTAGTLILVLVGLHVLAALYHRFWLRDGVLASMLGQWVGPRAPRESRAGASYRVRGSTPLRGH